MSIQDRLDELKLKLSKTPVNKGTEKERAKLKANIAKLEDKKESHESKISGKKGLGYGLRKSGDASISLVGPPSAGKSTLLNKLTNAESEIGYYEFTTLKVIPGVLNYKGAQIQILDVPGLIIGASKGKGRGKEVLSVIRNTDLIVLITDYKRLKDVKQLEQELYNSGIRLNQQPPLIRLKKKVSGGINLLTPLKLDLDEDTIKELFREYGIANADVLIRENITIDTLIDFLAGNRVYIHFIEILNKIDELSKGELIKIKKDFPKMTFISADKSWNLNRFVEQLWNNLELMRVYMKRIGKEPDRKAPLIIKIGSTVDQVCEKIHKEFQKNFNYARVWGKSAKFEGQNKGRHHILLDEDVLELHFK